MDASKHVNEPLPASIFGDAKLDKGDTLVFVDYSDIKRRPSEQTDCNGLSYSSQQFRVHSEKLLATGSTKFEEMLGQKYQLRVQKRKKLTDVLPEGVKYVLDLTPPSEGEDLVSQMMELSLTPGIIKWWAANDLHNVDSRLVTGHDDICSSAQHASDKDKGNTKSERITPPTSELLISKKELGIDEPYETPKYRDIPDYCPTRHRNNIVRLLMMMEGYDVTLDSANRVWTLVGLAKIFHCPSVVRDPVTQWIMTSENSTFIEVLPEEALKIGYTLELAQVTQCAFRILVTEFALKEASTSSGRDLNRVTIFGRRLGDLDDELRNVVQNAARALVERVSKIPDAFQSGLILNDSGIEEWDNLRKMESALSEETDNKCGDALNSLRILMRQIRYTVKEWFKGVTAGDETSFSSFISMDQDRATYVLPNDFESLAVIEKSMNLTQRLLCPFFYQQLGDFGNTNSFASRWLLEATSGLSGVFLEQVRNAVQQALDAQPSKADKPSWEVFLDPKEVLYVKYPLVNLPVLGEQIQAAIISSSQRSNIEPPLNITRHMLLTLDDNEMKFLPVWAWRP